MRLGDKGAENKGICMVTNTVLLTKPPLWYEPNKYKLISKGINLFNLKSIQCSLFVLFPRNMNQDFIFDKVQLNCW